MNETAKLRVGLVGCGRHGNALAEAITRSKSLRLVACADPDHAAANVTANRAADVSTHTSVDQLLAESDVDAVVIATPHHILGPSALTALRAGKHVLVEKPMALNEREAVEMEQAAEQAGVCLMPGYSMRFSMGRFASDLLQTGAIGDIRAATATIAAWPFDEGWMATPETGGGPLLFLGCHIVDMLLWLLGDQPSAVYASTQRRSDTGAEQTTAFQVSFAGSVVAQFLVTQASAFFTYTLTLVGIEGDLTLRGRNFLQYEVEIQSQAVPAYNDRTTIQAAAMRDNIQMMLLPELEEFAAAIAQQRAPAVTAADGRRVLRVLDAVLRSEETRQPVAIQAFDLPVAKSEYPMGRD